MVINRRRKESSFIAGAVLFGGFFLIEAIFFVPM